ncbi:MAG TPA: DEAD/DEAH box helicase [Phenylobacterium sp.]|jgi:ATP-dependent RNA helicase DeaD|uniref:DEAD/DEAH box helicase n=1 Tax=Phenylobacterium sp. TaxID=1871053 RepID=UPI002D625AF9|nr:DEAD/DEAH box helicase [Phenylobacterium sp.]HZZ67254.1 DEAD/DEAH box helicase [Phenylobacterium sp.]
MPFPATHPALERALEQQGYLEPTPVQAAVLQEPDSRDLLVSAQTGSGKTVAFGLALARGLLGEAERFGRPEAPLALVIAPTRELALQVSRELEWLYAQAGARVATCVGGMDPRAERRALQAGTHVVVGTPGRLRDHIERGALDLSALKVVVLDEADEMLDLGFREDLEEILDSTPVERRTLLFSATIAKEIATLARRYQRDAVRIDTLRRDEAHGDIEYRAIRVAPGEIEHAVVNLLRYFESPGALVFCNTREAVRRLHSALRERGFSAVGLSGEMTQKERSDALQALRDGHARACVATDVAARGLDLPDLGLVIHAELPVNKAGLLHRSGRTGRAGKKGTSVLVVPYNKRRFAERLLDSASIDAGWSGPPLADEIRAKDQQRLLADPILTEPASEEDLTLAHKILADSTPEQVAAALIRLHRSRLPEPEDLFDDVRETGQTIPSARPQRAGISYDPLREGPAPSHRPDNVGAEWFRMPIGRQNNADPKWLIPLICRLGHVTKKDIGQIRIFDRETKFEIVAETEARFRQAVKGAAEGDIRIEPAAAPPAADRPRGPRPGPHQAGPKPPISPRPPGGKFKGKPKRRPNQAPKPRG